MARKYTVTGLSTAPAATKPYAVFKTGANNPARITQIKFFNSTATLSIVQLIGINAVGTGTITSSAGIELGLAHGASAAVLETAWATTAPTVTGTAYSHDVLSASIGTGSVLPYQLDDPLEITIASGLVFYNPTASPCAALYITVEFYE